MPYKVGILGSGLQGAAAAAILSQDDEIDEIFLGDIDINLARKVTNKVDSYKISPVKVDASSVQDISSKFSDVDLIINMVPPRFNITVMQAALRINANYVDTACGPDLDLNPIDYMVSKQLDLNDAFAKKELCALIACGYTPGISDVFVKKISLDLESIEYVKIRVGNKVVATKEEDIFALVHNYTEILDTSWSPEVSFLYRASPPVIYKDGRYIRCKLFDGLEKYRFPAPVGDRWNVLVDHEEPILIPRFIDKDIKYVDYKNQPDLAAYILIKLGFASSKPIKIGRTEVTPRDIVLKLLKKPVNIFLDENEEIYSSPDLSTMCEIIAIEVEGTYRGKKIRRRSFIKAFIPANDADTRLHLFRKFKTLHFYVALPAIVGGKMTLKYDYRGVLGPEALDPIKFFDTLYSYDKRLPISVSLNNRTL